MAETRGWMTCPGVCKEATVAILRGGEGKEWGGKERRRRGGMKEFFLIISTLGDWMDS